MPQHLDDPSSATPGQPPGGADPFAPPAPRQAPGVPGAEGWPPPGAARRPAEKKLSGLAVTSLVVGVVGFVPPLSLVSLGLAIGAFRRIARRGQRGFVAAVAGLVLAWTWVLATCVVAGLLAFLVHDFSAGPERGPDGRPKYAGRAGPWYLKEGDCAANRIPTRDDKGVKDYQIVPCDQAHRFEVYAVVHIPGGLAYPGAAAVGQAAKRLCAEHRTVTDLPQGTRVGFYYPSAASWWLPGDHDALCYYSSALEWTGPLKPAATSGASTAV